MVDIKWENGKVVAASLLSNAGGVCKVKCLDKIAELQTEKERRYDLGGLIK